MTALAKGAVTPQMLPDPIVPAPMYYPALTNVKFYSGAGVVITAAGYAKPAVTGTGLRSVGIYCGPEDLDTTGIASGVKHVNVLQGVFYFANDATDDVDFSQVGGLCYWKDDHTISATDGTGTRSIAGTVYGVDAVKGVAVQLQLAAPVDGTALSAVDALAAHLAGTETITGDKTLSGTTTISGIIAASGAGAKDFSGSTGAFKTSTGLNTIGGDLLLAAGKILAVGAPQALSGAGAVNVTSFATLFTSTGGAQALSLANGTQTGQLKLVHHTVDGGSGVLTPATAGNFANFTLTAVHDACLLQWSGTAWNILMNVGGTVA